MSTRSALRRKVVLPVTVLRNGGEQKLLAHTLDLTQCSARLGGLYTVIEPGEVIEVQRGAIRGRFEVFWVGANGTPLAGQAGTRGVVAGKNIWGINLPADEPDRMRNAQSLRSDQPMVVSARDADDQRKHPRFDCNGGVSVLPAGSNVPVYAQITDISEGGVYLQTPAVLALNSEVFLRMNIEGFLVEMPGIVRASDPATGMGVEFQATAPRCHQMLALALQGLRQKRREADPALEHSGRLVVSPVPLAG